MTGLFLRHAPAVIRHRFQNRKRLVMIQYTPVGIVFFRDENQCGRRAAAPL